MLALGCFPEEGSSQDLAALRCWNGYAAGCLSHAFDVREWDAAASGDDSGVEVLEPGFVKGEAVPHSLGCEASFFGDDADYGCACGLYGSVQAAEGSGRDGAAFDLVEGTSEFLDIGFNSDRYLAWDIGMRGVMSKVNTIRCMRMCD